MKLSRHLLGLVTSLVAVSLQAQTTLLWTGIGDDGLFGTQENWDLMQSPSSGDTVQFGLIGGIYSQVEFSSEANVGNIEFLATRDIVYHLTPSFGSSSLALAGHIAVASGPNVFFDPGLNLNLLSGEHVFDISGTTVLQIDGVISGPGHFTKVGTGVVTLTGDNTFSYDGSLSFTNSSAIHAGTVILDGGKIDHGSTGDITIGDVAGDNGYLTIVNSGSANDYFGVIGQDVGSSGHVSLSGSGSTWSNSQGLDVGYSGAGTLTISNGATVTSANTWLAYGGSSTGTITLSGSGSSWTTGDATIAYGGEGLLTVNSGGTVTSGTSYLGYLPDSLGTAVVDGGTWNNSTYLYVGLEGQGEISITNGGSVSSPDTSIGNNFGGLGFITVNGSGSSLVNTGTIYVGAEGEGHLVIQNGGSATSSTGSVGNNADGEGGAVAVTGLGSTWTNSGALIIGNATGGNLTIDTQGLVSASTVVLGYLSSVTGLAALENESTLALTGDLVVGETGTGILKIDSGSQVTAGGYAVIANNFGSDGVVSLGGTGSTLLTGGDIYLGNHSLGLLYLTSGATVTSAAGTGAVRLGLSGGTGEIYIGYDGEGYGAGGFVNASSITTGSGTGLLVLGTDASSAAPYYLTRDGDALGLAVTVDGGVAVSQVSGYNVLLGTSTYAGGTSIYGGTLVAGSTGALGTGTVTVYGGKLGVASGVTLTNSLTLNPGAVLSGNGTFGSTVTVGNGIGLSPGNSPGTLTFSSGLVLADGGFLDFEVQSALGAAGTGYDTVVVSGGALDLSGLSAGGFTLKLISLNLAGAAGNVSDFAFTSSYAWTIFSTTGITGFNASQFTIDLTGFTNSLGTGSFVLTQAGNDLVLGFTAVPEPSTYALLGLGLGLSAVAAWRRRRHA